MQEVYREVGVNATKVLFRVQYLKWWHYSLFAKFVPVGYYAGNFRQDDPHQPCLSQDVKVGSNLGSPFQRVPADMDALESQARLSLARLELAWTEHSPQERAKKLASFLAALIGRFIQVHPFLNGNGRTSRVLWAWGLLRFGVPVQCRIDPRPDSPYGDLMQKAMTGNYGPLALYILQHFANHRPEQTT